MPAPANTLLIEGSFDELAEELSVYIDNLKKAAREENPTVQADVKKALEADNKDEALKALVGQAAVLNSAPEKELIAAYNLLVHLSRQSPNADRYLARTCQYLARPITSSPNNGPGLALSILGTIFNQMSPDDESRYHVFQAVIAVVKASNNFDALRSQLKNVDRWFAEWETDAEDQRKLYIAISEAAKADGEDDDAYEYLVRALRTIDPKQASSDEARQLSLDALKAALQHPTHFDFQDLTSLDSIQALRQSDADWIDLLDIFTADTLEEYNDFKDDHEGWIEAQGLDAAILNRKMRLLTLTSLAAQNHNSRQVSYEQIQKALQIPKEEVEMWVIDVIRAGLVEGKLSQLNQQFLVHRSTYRVFGDNQWREVAARLDMWKTSLTGVLQVIRKEKESYIINQESGGREPMQIQREL